MDTDRLTWRMRRRLARSPVAALRTRYEGQLRFVARRFSPEGALGLWLTLGLVVLACCGWAFGEVVEAVTEREELAALDSPVTRWLAAHRVAWATDVVAAVTHLGSMRVITPLVLAVTALVAARTRHWRHRLVPVLSAGGAALLVTGIKVLIERPRPAVGDIVATATGFSFPSGHSTQAMATYGALAWLATRWLSRRSAQALVWSAAAAVVLAVGFSRLYLGVHWPTDVVGGYILGAAWLILTLTATTTVGRLRDERRAPADAGGTRSGSPSGAGGGSGWPGGHGT